VLLIIGLQISATGNVPKEVNIQSMKTLCLLPGRCQLGGRAISHHGDGSRCTTRKQWCQTAE